MRKLLIVWTAVAASLASAQETPIDLQSFINGNRVQTYFSSYKNNSNGFKITFRNAAYPFCAFNYASPQDWSTQDVLIVDLTNLESRYLKMFLRIDDDVNANGAVNCRTGWITARKDGTVSAIFPLKMDPMTVGMRAFPPIGQSNWMADNRLPLNLRNITGFRFYIEFPPGTTNIIVRNPRLARVTALTSQIVDKYGQFSQAEWPGKIHSDAEMILKDQQEGAQLARDLTSGYNQYDGVTRDEYGGWMDGPQFLPTGRFRTTFYRGKWWFVDPNGFLFLSWGMNSIDYKDLPMIVTNRESFFNWLPPTDGPLGSHYYPVTGVYAGPTRTGLAYNFYSANLERKYGPDYVNINHIRTVDRLLAWGFNTIGAFANDEMWRMRRRVPYNAYAKILGDHHWITFSPGYKIHDPFDPMFRTDCVNAIAPVAAKVVGDPYCLGWFLDNELTWTDGLGEDSGRYSIAYGTLKEDISVSPGKQVWIQDLRTKYTTIEALNASWSTNFTSWGQLEGPTNLGGTSPAGRVVDFKNWMTKLARQYFRIVDESLAAVDPAALYLGCRFYRYTKEIMDASALYCDVLTFNIYGAGIPLKFWYPDIAYLQKPFMVGEFHFGATDRGMFHPGLAPSLDQRDRARNYTEYVKSILENQAFIGGHWFQYVDQPLLGRMYDGENYNNGFVTVTDTPYPELVEAARTVHFTSYPYRYYR